MPVPMVAPEEKKQILAIVRAQLPHCRVFAFGSRIRGTAKRYSDLDLSLDDGSIIPISKLGSLKEALAETRIPYMVDLTDFHRLDADFQSHVLKQAEVW